MCSSDLIAVSVDEGSGFVKKIRPTDWDFSGSAATPSLITFAAAPPSGSENVRITRVTPHPELVVNLQAKKFLRAIDLDMLFRQSIYYTEEVEDLI